MKSQLRNLAWAFLSVLAVLLRLLPRGVRQTLFRWVHRGSGGIGIALRYAVVKSLAQSCGRNLVIGPDCEIRSIHQISFGENVSIQRGAWIDAVGGLRIGSDVSIAAQTVIMTFDHGYEDPTRPVSRGPSQTAPVVLEGDIWVGAGVKILKGVTIHQRVVVAAGAVVTKDVPSGTVVGGVPARVLKEIPLRAPDHR